MISMILLSSAVALIINLYFMHRDRQVKIERKKADFICPVCGKRVVCGADFMADECGMDTSKGNFVVSCYHCSYCGAEIEVRDVGKNNKNRI